MLQEKNAKKFSKKTFLWLRTKESWLNILDCGTAHCICHACIPLNNPKKNKLTNVFPVPTLYALTRWSDLDTQQIEERMFSVLKSSGSAFSK